MEQDLLFVSASTARLLLQRCKIPPPEPRELWLTCVAGLGEGAQRVEHVEADFMTKPEEIAEKLKGKIKKV